MHINNLFGTDLQTPRPLLLRKSMYNDTDIEFEGKVFTFCSCCVAKTSIYSLKHVHTYVFLLQVVSFDCPERMALTIHWYLKYCPCHNEFSNIEVSIQQYVSNCGTYVLKVIVKKILNCNSLFAGNV